MLSGETAKGKYPIEAVETMAKCGLQAQCALSMRSRFEDMRKAMVPPLPAQEVCWPPLLIPPLSLPSPHRPNPLAVPRHPRLTRDTVSHRLLVEEKHRHSSSSLESPVSVT